MSSIGSSTPHARPHISLWPTRSGILLPALWATLIINLLGLALPLAALQIYDRVLASNTPGRWMLLLIAVLAAVVAEGLLRLARAHIAGQVGSKQEQKHTLTLISHMLRGSPRGRSAGHDLQTLESLAKLRDFSSGQVLTVLLDVPFAVIYLGLIAYLGGVLALVPVGLLLVFMGREFAAGHRLAHAMQSREKADIERKNGLIEAMERLHSVKAFGRVRWLQRRMEKLQYNVEKTSKPASTIAAQVYQEGLLFSQLMLAALTMAGTPLVLSGQMTLGALMACVLVGGRLMAPIQRGLGLYSRIQQALLARAELEETLARPIAFPATLHGRTDASHPTSLVLENLGIHSESGNRTPWLLRHGNMQAGKGQTIILDVADSHTGTCVLQTLAGLRAPSEGKVKLNGIEPHLLPAEELVQHVAYLSPHGTIYRGTIYENLSRFGQTPPERVAEMVKLLELESALAVLPRGVDTPLDNTLADPIAPGLKQRVALARTLALKPRIILFNQADHGLDQTGYNIVYRLLERLHGKVLLVLCTNDRNLTSLGTETWVQAGSTLRRRLTSSTSAPVIPFQRSTAA